MKGRDKQALAVLAKINKHTRKEMFVDTLLQLKELQATVSDKENFSTLFRELFHLKNRYVIMQLHV
jgi:hypothetical protein